MAALAIDLSVLQFRRIRVLAILLVAALAVIAVVPAISPALAGIAAVGLVVAEVSVYRGLRPVTPPCGQSRPACSSARSPSHRAGPGPSCATPTPGSKAMVCGTYSQR